MNSSAACPAITIWRYLPLLIRTGAELLWTWAWQLFRRLKCLFNVNHQKIFPFSLFFATNLRIQANKNKGRATISVTAAAANFLPVCRETYLPQEWQTKQKVLEEAASEQNKHLCKGCLQKDQCPLPHPSSVSSSHSTGIWYRFCPTSISKTLLLSTMPEFVLGVPKTHPPSISQEDPRHKPDHYFPYDCTHSSRSWLLITFMKLLDLWFFLNYKMFTICCVCFFFSLNKWIK